MSVGISESALSRELSRNASDDGCGAESMIKFLKLVSSVCTITLDNDGEFTAHEKVAKAMNADIYFAKPYASYQRGTNENTNGIIRRTWPKKMAFRHLTEDDVRTMGMLINILGRF
ncbi:MAG: IS30 family transposase [Candidatus Endonucleobacter sp. (ex Gigantidas childressi)]|nr:IS30 family transposase [Candidatus Endonucleobacter sp. (ex Gigantidas childressi)]